MPSCIRHTQPRRFQKQVPPTGVNRSHHAGRRSGGKPKSGLRTDLGRLASLSSSNGTANRKGENTQKAWPRRATHSAWAGGLLLGNLSWGSLIVRASDLGGDKQVKEVNGTRERGGLTEFRVTARLQ